MGSVEKKYRQGWNAKCPTGIPAYNHTLTVYALENLDVAILIIEA
jgi:hypothetical protein